MNRPPKIIFVTGTDTDVGKTITTAALAAELGARGRTVAMYKPAQAGTCDGQGDIDVVRRLAGLTMEALARRGIAIHGLVIGSWPRHPTDIDTSNRNHLSRHAVPLIGIIPESAGTLTRAEFTTSADGWFTTRW